MEIYKWNLTFSSYEGPYALTSTTSKQRALGLSLIFRKLSHLTTFKEANAILNEFAGVWFPWYFQRMMKIFPSEDSAWPAILHIIRQRALPRPAQIMDLYLMYVEQRNSDST